MNSKELYRHLPADYYDYIIVDEFHHAAAKTYHSFLSYFKPQILLGLTATPERMDGQSVLGYFDGQIAAEIRLPEAIDRKLLCPFEYFGVSDSVDLDGLRWTNGGYADSDLDNLYVFSHETAIRRADLIIRKVLDYTTDIDAVKGLGFCVSVKHADFMAEQFMKAGIPSISLSAESSDAERDSAKTRLQRGEIKFIFVVDLYNEGVDIPEVNTILFLRPTKSLTVFLQQLGRGLRLFPGKDCLTVLDFIGRQNQKFSFEQRYAALMEPSRQSVKKQVESGFSSLPKGCYITLEKVAQAKILDNISRAANNRRSLTEKVRTFTEDSGRPLTLANFLDYYSIPPRELYGKNLSFSLLKALAGIITGFDEPAQDEVKKALRIFSSVDAINFIEHMETLLREIDKIGDMGGREGAFRLAAAADKHTDETDLAIGYERGIGAFTTVKSAAKTDGSITTVESTAKTDRSVTTVESSAKTDESAKTIEQKLRLLLDNVFETPLKKNFFEMFYITIFRNYADSPESPVVITNMRRLLDSPVMRSELEELLAFRKSKIDFVIPKEKEYLVSPDYPLSLHCTYTRDQLFTGLGYSKAMNVREGVKWLAEANADVLLVTLNKSDKDYSPTTMYQDYSVNEILFHWQSQSTTSEQSETGQRYIHHQERGSRILLFVREYKEDSAGSVPYTFLGLADYVSHEGSCPMTILWHLEDPIQAKFISITSQMSAI